MNKNTRLAVGAAVVALGLLTVLTPRYLFPICEYHGIFIQMPNGKTDHMHCYYTAMGASITGLMIALIGVTLLFSRTQEALRRLAVILAGAALAVMMTPVIFPICQNPDEPCNHGTKPLLIVLGLASLIMAGWVGTAARGERSSESELMSGSACRQQA